jgi:hypothetical protein
MAEDVDDIPERPQADLFSREEDGTKTDVWVMDELLGDDPVHSDYHHVLDEGPVHLGGAGSGNFGHRGRPGEVGGSADAGTAGTTGLTFTKQPNNDIWEATKKDGGVVRMVIGGEEQVLTHVFGPHDPRTIAGQMLEDVPGDLRVTWIQYRQNVMMLMVESDDDDENGIAMQRTFIRQTDGSLTVRHDEFVVPKAQQGKDLAKAVLADSMHTYREMGVSKISTYANMNVGGYAWAKFGFTAQKPGDAAVYWKHQMYDLLDDGHLTQPEVTALREVIDTYKDDPKLPWHVAGVTTAEGKPIGKTLLVTANWDAELRLNDAEAMARFDHYVKGR